MRYVISSQPLYFLQQFEIPKKDKYGNLDLDAFYNSNEGVRFREIKPLVIEYIKNKKDMSFKIAMDISWISLCYNCDLFIYVMSDNFYFDELKLGLHTYRNFGKVTELHNLRYRYNSFDFPEYDELRVDINTTYYKGEMEKINEEVCKILNVVNLREKSLWGYKLSAQKGFKSI